MRKLPDDNVLKKDILLADDDADEVLIFETALQELNHPHTLRHAIDGDALFALLKDKIPYILFLDIHMPCKDGVACITEIRKNREYDNLPVIIYTSNHAPKIADECFVQGANFYLQKGYTLQTLTENLKKIFSIEWNGLMHYPPRENFIIH